MMTPKGACIHVPSDGGMAEKLKGRETVEQMSDRYRQCLTHTSCHREADAVQRGREGLRGPPPLDLRDQRMIWRSPSVQSAA